jgi:hypothetical protein
MEPIRISRGYKQTIQVKTPDGRDAWISHEAVIEAELSQDDAQNMTACYAQLATIAKAEVVTSIKEQKTQIAQACEAASVEAPARSRLNG